MAILNCTIEIKPDGVYLTVVKKSVADKITESELMDEIKEFDIKDVDLTVLPKFISSEEIITTLKVSNNKDVKNVDETASVRVDQDNMNAYITFSPPINEGARFDIDSIKKIIFDSGVTYGLIEDEINNIGESRVYNKQYHIAEGKKHIDGRDGYIKYNFDVNKKSLKPVLLDDGTADYFNIKLYEETSEGFVLAERIPPTAGENGMEVNGNIITAHIGKVAGKLPSGKNTHFSEDGESVIASCSGQIDYNNGKLNINPVLTLRSVNNTTGNIDFNGAVVVEGDVIHGFSIKAAGNIEVKGTVEGCELTSEGDIFILSGLRGREKAIINARGNITVKFVENAKLVAGGSIYSNSIMHSVVEANNELILAGKNGYLVGGNICVGDKIEAVTVGSHMATQTIIELGNTPEKLAIVKPLQESLKSIENNIFKTEQIINMLKASKVELSEEKKKLFIKSHHTKIHLLNTKVKVEQDLADIIPTLDSKNGVLIATNTLYSGVKITIGHSIMSVKDQIESCKIYIEDDKIVVTSCY